MEPLYTATVTASQGREGYIHREAGTLNLSLAMPKAIGGPGGAKTNPEQLFAAGYAACFGGAIMMVARLQKLDVGDCKVVGKVHIGKADGGFALSVELVGHFANIKGEQAKKLMAEAHKHCPYSKATRNNLEVKLSVA